MDELFKLIDEFEKRNNISVFLELCSDGSGCIREFWDNEKIKHFDKVSELLEFLKNGKLKLAEDGRSVSPIEIIN